MSNIEQTKLPNILIFMTDQQRGDSVQDKDIEMPHLRALMQEGITFNSTYSPSPHCCPSRASFFTAQYPTQHEVWNNVCVQNALSRKLSPDAQVFSEKLAQQNYALFFAGKWHVCYETGPEDHGFQELFVTSNKESKLDPTSQSMATGWDAYKVIAEAQARSSTAARQPGEIIRPGYPNYVHYGVDENPFNDRGVVDSALEQLQKLRQRSVEEAQQPWMMYVGTLGPHDPYFVPQEFLDKYQDTDISLTAIHKDKMLDKPTLNRKVQALFNQLSDQEKIDSIRHYMAFCTYEDALFGLIVEELKKHPDFDNTLIIFTSDHGDYKGEHGLWCKGLPAFKGAYHIPAVMYWKNKIVAPGRQVDDLISLTDLAPTVLSAAETHFDSPTVGKTLLPYLLEQPNEARDYLYTQTNGNEIYGIQRGVFNHHWKLIHNTYDNDELYDLKTDPDELINLALDPEYLDVRKSLYQKLWKFAYDNQDKNINPYIFVGLSEFGPASAFI